MNQSGIMGKQVLNLLVVLLIGHLTLSDVPAQQSKQINRIGYLSSGTAASESARSQAIRQALREIGYIEGQNIAIEIRYGGDNFDRGAEFVTELVRLKIELIVVTGGERWVELAKNAAKAVPIVMTGTGDDPVEAGLVKSLARPGGNVTGVTTLSKELGGKRLEILKQAIPKLSHVAVLYNPAAPSTVEEVKKDLPLMARASD